MTLTIVSACLKGGAGKSTVASTIADVLHASGHRTLVVDVDSQRTLARWAAVASEAERPGPSVVGVEGGALRRELERLSPLFDVVVVDCPPKLGKETRAAILAADLVLVPLTPGPGDLWALDATLELIEEVRVVRPELRAAAVINRANAQTAITRAMREEVASRLAVLGPVLSSRVAFPEAMALGQGVSTYAPGTRAAEEAHAVTEAALALLERRAAA